MPTSCGLRDLQPRPQSRVPTAVSIGRAAADLEDLAKPGLLGHRPGLEAAARGDSMADLLVGIDIGGTKTATSAGDSGGRVIARTRRPTPSHGDPRADVAAIAEDVRKLLRQAGRRLADVACVGVSVPGPLDPSGTRLLAPPNLEAWEDVPLGDWLGQELGVPVCLENDANAAALAEWRFGAGRGFEDVVYLTMSTGVGGGLILGGRLHRGAYRAAGEVGHARVCWDDDADLCGCGRRGCLEAYVGGASWARRLAHVTPPRSRVAALAGDGAIAAEHVVRAARDGDAFALAELDRYNRYLARGIVNLAFTLAPQAIVLGTIPSAAGEELCLGPVRAAVREALWPVIAEKLQVLPAQLGDELPALAGLVVAVEGLARA
jgi:glucokinase